MPGHRPNPFNTHGGCQVRFGLNSYLGQQQQFLTQPVAQTMIQLQDSQGNPVWVPQTQVTTNPPPGTTTGGHHNLDLTDGMEQQHQQQQQVQNPAQAAAASAGADATSATTVTNTTETNSTYPPGSTNNGWQMVQQKELPLLTPR